MRKAEHYSLTNRYGFEGKICFVFSNNLSRDYTVDVDMPLGFEQLPVNDPRIQNLLEETLRRINDPIFEIPEIKRFEVSEIKREGVMLRGASSGSLIDRT